MKQGLRRLLFIILLLGSAGLPAACAAVETPLPSFITTTTTVTAFSTATVSAPYTVTFQPPPVTVLPPAVTLPGVTQTVTFTAIRTVTVLETTVATGATASYQVSLSPTSPIFVGDNVTVSGSGFLPGTPVTVIVDDTTLTLSPSPVTDGNGSFNVNFSAPALAKGQHSVRVKVGVTSPVIGSITIREKLLSLNPNSGPAGTAVMVSGTGFGPGSAPVAVDGTVVGMVAVEANGSFTDAVFTIPLATPAGLHNITIQGVAAPPFNLVPSPKVVITPTSGVYGDTITLTGTGFGALKPITMVIDDIYNLGTAMSNAVGGFTATFTVPNLPAGQHVIQVTDGGGKVPSALLVINPRLALGALTAKAGDRVSLLGTGFAASRQIVVLFGDNIIGTDPVVVPTSQYGTFSAYITIPAGTGSVTITATDGTNSASASFTYLP